MDDKRPIIITTIILGVLIVALVVVMLFRSCGKSDDLLPGTTTASETAISGSDNSGITDITLSPDATNDIPEDPNATTTTTLFEPDNTDATTASTTAQTVAPATEPGEVIVTEATKNGGDKTPTKKPTKTPTKPADPTKSPATNGPIELPFVPADEL